MKKANVDDQNRDGLSKRTSKKSNQPSALNIDFAVKVWLGQSKEIPVGQKELSFAEVTAPKEKPKKAVHSLHCLELEKLLKPDKANSHPGGYQLPNTRKQPSPLPGISYIAEKFEWKESEDIQARVIQEFIDFLTCVTDLLDLIHIIPTDYLRSTVPMPTPMVRELLASTDKGQTRDHIKAFESILRKNRAAHHQSESLERVLCRKDCNMKTPYKHKSALPNIRKQNPGSRKTAQDIGHEVEKILGKKQLRPIWQTVAMERKPHDDQSMLEERLGKASERGNTDCIMSHFLKHNALDDKSRRMSKDSRTRARLKYLTSTDTLNPSNESYRRQLEMTQAFLDGFVDLEKHRAYIESLQPHWYTELLQKAIDAHVVITEGVKSAFLKLGRFYWMATPHHGEAKLCLLIQSFAVWDAVRLTMQRAVVFVLQSILGVVEGGDVTLERWLSARRLPCLLVPPVVSKVFTEGHVTPNSQIQFRPNFSGSFN